MNILHLQLRNEDKQWTSAGPSLPHFLPLFMVKETYGSFIDLTEFTGTDINASCATLKYNVHYFLLEGLAKYSFLSSFFEKK